MSRDKNACVNIAQCSIHMLLHGVEAPQVQQFDDEINYHATGMQCTLYTQHTPCIIPRADHERTDPYAAQRQAWMSNVALLRAVAHVKFERATTAVGLHARRE